MRVPSDRKYSKWTRRLLLQRSTSWRSCLCVTDCRTMEHPLLRNSSKISANPMVTSTFERLRTIRKAMVKRNALLIRLNTPFPRSAGRMAQLLCVHSWWATGTLRMRSSMVKRRRNFGCKLRTIISLVQPSGMKFNILNGRSLVLRLLLKIMLRIWLRILMAIMEALLGVSRSKIWYFTDLVRSKSSGFQEKSRVANRDYDVQCSVYVW